MRRKFDLPEGYKSVAQLLKEFRDKHPDGMIETSAIVSNGDFVVVTATVKAGSLSATGIADADLQQGKGSSRAESAAIRRALVHLGFESVEADHEAEEQEERPNRFSRPRDEDKKEDKPKKSFSKSRDEDEDDEEQEGEELRSRFISKSSKSEDEEEFEDQEEGKPKFERGSRFKRG
jgi:hypothetical protein